jgi:membrane-bound ClpP family serine protease
MRSPRAPFLLWFLLLLAGLLPAADDATAPVETPATAVAVATGAAPAAVAPSAPSLVAYIPIQTGSDGHIDEEIATNVRDALHAAVDHHADVVVMHITTNGGEMSAAMDILYAELGLPKDHPRLIACIDDHCYSAGGMIAYGCDEIWIRPHAPLGDIGVIFFGLDGKMEYAPEKAQTAGRTALRSAAETRGWDAAKLQKMMALNQDLYRFDVKGAPSVFVLEDDLPAWLVEHPGVNRESAVLILGHDRLRCYTGSEAVADHMATGLLDGDGIAGLYRHLGVDPSAVVDLTPGGDPAWPGPGLARHGGTAVPGVPATTHAVAADKPGWLYKFAPLLALLTVVFLFLEFQHMGVMIYLVLAAISGTAFFICQFYSHLAGPLEVGLVLVGVALIYTEILVLPTMGWLAILGTALAAVGLVLSFMPDDLQFHVGAAGWGHSLEVALADSVLVFAVGTACVVMAISSMSNSAYARRLASKAAIAATSAGTEESAQALVGASGTVRAELAPSGSVLIAGLERSAMSDNGAFIPAGTPVTVVAMRYGSLLVRAAAPAPGAPGAPA